MIKILLILTILVQNYWLSNVLNCYQNSTYTPLDSSKLDDNAGDENEDFLRNDWACLYNFNYY